MLQLQLRTPNDPTGICKGSADLDRDNNNHNKLLSDLFLPFTTFQTDCLSNPQQQPPTKQVETSIFCQCSEWQKWQGGACLSSSA